MSNSTSVFIEERGPAILILPLVALEAQVEADLAKLGLRFVFGSSKIKVYYVRFVSLTCSPPGTLAELIRTKRPHVLVSNVESLTSPDVQRRISQLNISYISVDEAQV